MLKDRNLKRLQVRKARLQGVEVAQLKAKIQLKVEREPDHQLSLKIAEEKANHKTINQIRENKRKAKSKLLIKDSCAQNQELH